MKSFKQFISQKTTPQKSVEVKKPLDYAAVRAAASQSKPLQKTGKTSYVMHREEEDKQE